MNTRVLIVEDDAVDRMQLERLLASTSLQVAQVKSANRLAAALDLLEEADTADQMLVDRIVMIHVELHHRDDTTELGNKFPEKTRLVHPAKNNFR